MITGRVDKRPRYIQACLIYAEVLEMAPILDRADSHLVARIHFERESGIIRDIMAGAPLGASGGAAVLDYIRLRDPGRIADFTDSIRDAETLLEIRRGVGSRDLIKHQYGGLTACLEHALPSSAD